MRQLASKALAAEGAGLCSGFAEDVTDDIEDSAVCLAGIAAGMVQRWFHGCLGRCRVSQQLLVRRQIAVQRAQIRKASLQEEW